jgi:multidrug efflux pump subunit AcrB
MISSFRTVILFIAISVLSVFCIQRLKVNLLPVKDTKELTVTFNVSGSSPEHTEQIATSVLENALSQIRDLKNINSVSGSNSGRVNLVFESNQDLAVKRFEVVSLLRQISLKLPPGVSFPIVSQMSDADQTSKFPTLVYVINAPTSPTKIKEVADEIIKRKISVIRGIKDVEIEGVSDLQVTVKFNKEKLKSNNLGAEAIIEAIKYNTNPIYPGVVNDKVNGQYFIKVKNTSLTVNSLADIVIDKTNAVRIRDVAQVFLEEKEADHYFRIKGKNALAINIYFHKGLNAVKFATLIKDRIQTLKSELPKGFGIVLNYDDSEFLRVELIKNYQRTAIALLVLLVFIFAFYRNWRNVVNLFLSLTVNISLTIIFAWFLNVNIHLYTLAGIAIVFGIMVDHAIVMIDYFNQFKNRKIFLGLFAATLTTIVALSLTYLLPEEESTDLVDFSLIVIIGLITSLITNLFFTVELYKLLFSRYVVNKKRFSTSQLRKQISYRHRYRLLVFFLAKYRRSFCIVIALVFGLPFFLLPEKIENAEWYNNTIGSSVYKKSFSPFVNSWLGGTLRLFAVNVFENRSNRDVGKTKLYINAQLSLGNTIQQVDLTMRTIEEYLNNINGINQYITYINSERNGLIEVTFNAETENTGFPSQLKTLLSSKVVSIGGVNWSIYGVGYGFSNASANETPNFKVKIMGYKYDDLEKQANNFAEKIVANKRIQKINTNTKLNYDQKSTQEYVLSLNDHLINMFGFRPRELFTELSYRSKQIHSIDYIQFGGVSFPLFLKEDNSMEYSMWDVMNGNIDGSSKTSLKIRDVGNVKLQQTINEIYKENRQYVRVVSLEYLGFSHLGSQFLEDKLKELRKEMPIGFSAKLEGKDYRSQQESDNKKYMLIVLLLVANYIICSMLFENLKQPLYIIATIPISFIGLFLSFYLFDFPFDQGGYAAFIMLGGLLVNSGIFIVRDFNHLRIGKPKREYNKLLINATLNRSRTIILTTIATICSLVPFLIDGPNEVFWFSLAVGTIGGLLFSIFSIFIALPVFLYKKDD